MLNTYLNGFSRYLVTVITPRFGTFTAPFWARTAAHAIAAANRKYGKGAAQEATCG